MRIGIGLMLAMVAGAARADNSPDAAPAGSPGPLASAASPVSAAPRVWVWMERSLPVTQAATIRTAPSDTADAAGQATVGQDIFVVGLLQDREWLQIQPPGTQAPAYVHAATVAADEPPPPGKPAPLPISGHPTVRDTATLLVEDHVVPLAGVQGYGGALADGLQRYLDANGAFVLCTQVTDSAYSCKTRDGVDLASVALVNGVARMTADAPAADAVQQTAAQQHQRGIWAPQADPPAPAPPPPPPPLLPDWETEFYVLDPVVPLDPDGGPALAGADPLYGAVVIDGELVTVVGGARVRLAHDPDRGWGFHDRAGLWHAPPARLDHALDRHYGAHPPAFDDHGRAHELGRPLVRDAAFGGVHDARGERPEMRADAPGAPRDARTDMRAGEPGLHEPRGVGQEPPREGTRLPGDRFDARTPAAPHGAMPGAHAPNPAPGFAHQPSARGFTASPGGRSPTPAMPRPMGAPGYMSRPGPGVVGTPGYVSHFGAGAPRVIPGQGSFYGRPGGYPGTSPAMGGAPRMGMPTPRMGMPGAAMPGMRPGGMPQRPAMPTINRAPAVHPSVCRKAPC